MSMVGEERGRCILPCQRQAVICTHKINIVHLLYHTVSTQLYEELSDIILGKHNTQLRFNSDTHYGIHTRQNY
jgi:hypothetical protein